MKRDYSIEEINLALAAFCLEGGRLKPTERLLEAAGLDIPYATVRGWAYNSKTHHERYERIATEVEKQVRGQLRDQYHRLARTSAELSEDILARINAELSARDSELLEVEVALERLGEIIEDSEQEHKERRALWERRDRLRLDLREMSKLLHESGVMGGIATEKHQLLSGRATERVEHSFPEIRRALEEKGVRLQVGQGRPALPAGSTNGDSS